MSLNRSLWLLMLLLVSSALLSTPPPDSMGDPHPHRVNFMAGFSQPNFSIDNSLSIYEKIVLLDPATTIHKPQTTAFNAKPLWSFSASFDTNLGMKFGLGLGRTRANTEFTQYFELDANTDGLSTATSEIRTTSIFISVEKVFFNRRMIRPLLYFHIGWLLAKTEYDESQSTPDPGDTEYSVRLTARGDAFDATWGAGLRLHFGSAFVSGHVLYQFADMPRLQVTTTPSNSTSFTENFDSDLNLSSYLIRFSIGLTLPY